MNSVIAVSGRPRVNASTERADLRVDDRVNNRRSADCTIVVDVKIELCLRCENVCNRFRASDTCAFAVEVPDKCVDDGRAIVGIDALPQDFEACATIADCSNHAVIIRSIVECGFRSYGGTNGHGLRVTTVSGVLNDILTIGCDTCGDTGANRAEGRVDNGSDVAITINVDAKGHFGVKNRQRVAGDVNDVAFAGLSVSGGIEAPDKL